MAQFATVVAITGNGTVFAINAQGESRALKAGDTLQKGEIIRTVGDARVELMMDDGQLLAVAPDQSILLDENVAESDQRPTAQDSAVAAQVSADAIIQALERGTDLNETLEAPAAGVAGDGGADSGSSFVQLLRIVEGVDPLAYNYDFTAPDLPPDLETEPAALPVNATVTFDDVTVNEGAGTATINATLSHAVTGSPLVLTLSNGATITFAVGATTGTSTAFAVQGDDVYKDGESYEVGIVSTSGGDFGAIDASDTALVTINDTIDLVTATLTATSSTSEDGGKITYTVTLSNADGLSVTGHDGVSFTLANGEVVNIAAGSASGTVDVDVNRDDVFVETDAITNRIVSKSGDAEFENLQFNPATVSTTITDDKDTVTATLSADVSEIPETGGSITYTITLSGGPGAIAPKTNLVFTLANGETVTVEAGKTSGSYIKVYADGDITTQASISNSIGSVVGGAEYEELKTAGTTTVDVDYGVTITGIGATGGDETVYENDLTNGTSPDSANLTQTGSFSLSALDGIKSVQVGGTTLTYTQLVTLATTNAVVDTPYGALTLTGYVGDEQGGTVSYSYTLDTTVDNDSQVGATGTGFMETVAVTVTDMDDDNNSATLNIKIVDDAPTIDVKSAVSYTLAVTNYGETSAGYNNSFGYYIKDAEGNPTTGVVIWDNVKNFTNGSVTITGYTADQVGFFIIPDGDRLNPGLTSNTEVTFRQVDGNWQAFAGGTPLAGNGGANVLFDSVALNPGDKSHVEDNAKPGNLNWEDINGPGSDWDYDDINIGVVWSSNLPALTTQDADTIGGAKDEAGALFAALFSVTSNPGADGPGSQSVAYSLSVGNLASGLSSDGEAISLYLIDGKVVGTTADTAGGVNANNMVFDISVDANGHVKLTQYAELDHPGENDDGNPANNSANLIGLPDGAVKLTATATIIDNDGDPASDAQTLDISASFRFEDDVPTLLAPTATHIIDLATSPAVTAALNFMAGADGVGSVGFTFAQGTVAKDADGNELSFNGQPLYLHYGQTGGVIDYSILVATISSTVSVTGVSTTGTNVGFWIDIDPMANTYTLHSNGVIENGTPISSATVEQIGGGNKEWKAFINLGGTQEDAFLSTKSGDSVNTNAGEIGISDGNSFKVGEGLRIDFVNGLTVAKVQGEDTYTFTNGSHNLTNAFRQIVSFTNKGNANITLTAIIANDLDATFYRDADDVKVNLSVSDVKVYDATGTLVTTGLTFTDNADGSITVNGIQQGWTFEINSASKFNAVQIDAAAESGTFKLGVFSYGEASDGTPIELNYGIVGTDGDGDAINGSIDVTMYPKGPTILGTDASETLTGTAGTDYILAGAGNDTLIGGAGNDTLVGGLGADVFKWNFGDQGTSSSPAVDHIADFSKAEGDKLNLADLLKDQDTTDLAKYLSFGVEDGKAVLSVNVDGSVDGTVEQKIVFDNYTLAELQADFDASSGADLIAKMKTSGNLIITD